MFSKTRKTEIDPFPRINSFFLQIFVVFCFVNIVCIFYTKNERMCIIVYSMLGLMASWLYTNQCLEEASLVVIGVMYWALVSHSNKYLTSVKILIFIVLLGFNLILNV